ncbi:hypothetical protein DFH06DRAFT_1132741 [Mycena polygramma]|nr:hypothetical protein DFH06DRAFT_1132741 [Mycena polygramma]
MQPSDNFCTPRHGGRAPNADIEFQPVAGLDLTEARRGDPLHVNLNYERSCAAPLEKFTPDSRSGTYREADATLLITEASSPIPGFNTQRPASAILQTSYRLRILFRQSHQGPDVNVSKLSSIPPPSPRSFPRQKCENTTYRVPANRTNLKKAAGRQTALWHTYCAKII